MEKSKKNRSTNIIKIEVADYTAEWKKLDGCFSRWEDDGGAPKPEGGIFSNVDVPFNPGDTFKVVRTRLINSRGKVYYEAELLPITSD